MKNGFRPVVLAAIMAVCLLSPAQADEGLWLFDQPPRLLLKERYQFDLEDAFLERLQKSTVHVSRGGSGGFVSADGLVMTNHHVALSWLEELAADKKDLIKTGFYANRRDQELPCPDMELRVVWSMADVTARVHEAVKPSMTMAEASKARRDAMRAIEKESRAATGLESEVVGLYHGGQYHLYRCKKYTDVRLVFAPAKVAIGRDGAVPPAEAPGAMNAYTTDHLDVCFLRAYEKGKPARPVHYLPFAKSLPQAGDLLLAAGFPDSTHRFRAAAELEEMYGKEFFLEFKAAVRELAVLEAFAKEHPDEAEAVQEDIAGLSFGLHRHTGSLQKLEKHLAGRRRAEKAEHAKLLTIDKELAARRRQALARIEACNRAGESAFRRVFYLESPAAAFSGDLFGFARYLVRKTGQADDTLPAVAAHEKVEDWRKNFFASRPFNKKIEIARLAESLELFASQAGEDADLAGKILAGKSPEECAVSLVHGSRLDELPVRLALLKGGKKAVSESTDPMVVLARLVEERARQVYKEYDDKVNEPSRQAHAMLHSIRQKSMAGLGYPDATNTLRLSFGKVSATSDTLAELLEYKLPMNWQAATARLQKRMPLSLAASVDGTFGFSGSPVVDREGRVVSLVATGSDTEVGSELAFDQEKMYCGTVCARGIVEVLDKVYQAGPLVKELGGNVLLKEVKEEQPDAAPVPPRPGPSVAKRHKELVPALIKALKDADAEVAQAAAQALGNIGADAVESLIEAAESKDRTLRALSALALGKMGPAGQGAIPALLKLLVDAEISVRREAARALASVVQDFGPYGPPYPGGPMIGPPPIPGPGVPVAPPTPK